MNLVSSPSLSWYTERISWSCEWTNSCFFVSEKCLVLVMIGAQTGLTAAGGPEIWDRCRRCASAERLSTCNCKQRHICVCGASVCGAARSRSAYWDREWEADCGKPEWDGEILLDGPVCVCSCFLLEHTHTHTLGGKLPDSQLMFLYSCRRINNQIQRETDGCPGKTWVWSRREASDWGRHRLRLIGRNSPSSYWDGRTLGLGQYWTINRPREINNNIVVLRLFSNNIMTMAK